MSLPHVLLGLLQTEPRTGYELARAIREELDPYWGAGFSQIYPALAALRRRGWVRLRVLGPGRGPRRLLYRATAAGRRELRRWMEEPPPSLRRNDAGLARAAFLDALPAPARRAVQARLAAALAAEVARLSALPEVSGSRAFARRVAIEERVALCRFLHAGDRRAPGAPAARPRDARPERPPPPTRRNRPRDSDV